MSRPSAAGPGAVAGAPPLRTSLGVRLDADAAAFGELRDSSARRGDPAELRRRLAEEGYLLLRGLLDPEAVRAARRSVTEALAAEGLLDPRRPAEAAVASAHARTGVQSEAGRFPAVRGLLRSEPMLGLYRELLDEEVRVYDHVWLRPMSPGRATGPHCDLVYAGRGTQELYTSWVPLGDVPLAEGPAMVLEGSQRRAALRRYARMDVDAGRNWSRIRFRDGRFFRGGDYSQNPRAVRRRLGGRWLSADFRAGDVLVFTALTLHGSLDNRSDRIRISADTRYQRASEPADERWVGERPPGHRLPAWLRRRHASHAR